MNNNRYNRILGLIEDIELTNDLLAKLTALGGAIDQDEYERKKRNLVKKLLTEMVGAGVSLQQFEEVYDRMFSYLKREEKEQVLSKEWQESIARVATIC